MMEIIGDVSSLAFGGKGVVRVEGLVVFVPFVSPGERIRARITKEHKRFAEGELVEILAPSPLRVAAPCPYFGQCGGCQLQHLRYEEQLKQKQNFVTDALQRIGKIHLDSPLPIVPAHPIWGYRRHVHLSLEVFEGHYRAGYICIDGSTHLPITQCPIFMPTKLDLLQIVSDLIPEGDARLGIYKNKDQFIISYEFSNNFPSNLEKAALKQLAQYPQIQGITARCPTKTKTWGNIHGTFSVDPLEIIFTPWAFVQNHANQSANIYRQMVELSGKSVLDLYCGMGSLSLLLAYQGATVTGVECSEEAIRLANLNALQNNLKAEFICDDVAKRLPQLLQKSWDTVIINPPRTGLDPMAREALLKARPKQILYLSCMPATLARDLAAAQQAGYQIGFCQAYDMFPQTTHVETLVELNRINFARTPSVRT